LAQAIAQFSFQGQAMLFEQVEEIELERGFVPADFKSAVNRKRRSPAGL
jgi:hypothetical protein